MIPSSSNVLLLALMHMLQSSSSFTSISSQLTMSIGGGRQSKKRPAIGFLSMVKSSKDSEKMQQKSKKKKDIKNKAVEEEEDFAAFLQRMSQWPLVEALDAESKMEVPPTRNPFMSPWTDLFEEVISWKEEEISTDANTALNKEQLDVLFSWGKFITTIQQSFGNDTAVVESTNPIPSTASYNNLANDIFQRASTGVESALSAATTAVSPDVFNSVIKQARNVLRLQDDLVAVATSAAEDKGLDTLEAAERARNTTDFVASLVSVADQVLRAGYVQKEENAAIAYREERQESSSEILKDTTPSGSKPLFENIPSAHAISYDEFGPAISTIAEMGWLSGGIYENELERAHELGHSIVGQGISSDVYWIVTDSVENESDFESVPKGRKGKDIPVRTIVVRGFDASDERVDREILFTEILNLESRPFDEKHSSILVHRGIYALADSVYRDVKRYIDWSAPSQKLIFTGHSIGGSISILLGLMLARDRGAKYVRDKVLRIFTFGSPPTLKIKPGSKPKKGTSENCRILDAFGLPSSLVYGSIQPWDPIPRLFSPIDGLYPLVDDIGEDGLTLYANGPPRSLRFVARALVDAWEGWPQLRDKIRAAGPQEYQHVGIQHIILPEPVQYLTDRFLKVNVQVPPVDELVRLSPAYLYEALETIFPLDVFELSYLTSGVRGFLHHFYPAYDAPLVQYAQKVSAESDLQTPQERRVRSIEATTIATDEELDVEEDPKRRSWGQAERWLKNVAESTR